MNDELERLASDAEREQLVVRLRAAAAEGRLTFEELAERTSAAYVARSHAQLAPLVADLPDSASSAPRPPAKRRRRWVVSTFGPLVRSGRRAFAEHTVVLSLFGPVQLDLRDASLPAPEAEITVVSLFGPVTLTVPEHVDVDVSVLAVFGPVRESSTVDAPPGAPRLAVRGVSLFGPVLVRAQRR